MKPAQELGVAPLGDRLVALIVILTLAMVVTPLFSGVLRGLFGGLAWGPGGQSLGLLLQEIVLIGATLYRLSRLGVSWSDVGPFIEEVSEAVQGISWGVGFLFLNGLTAQMTAALFHLLLGADALLRLIEREQAAVMGLLDPDVGPFQLGFTVFLAVGVAPLVEEVFFRGYAYRVLKYHTGPYALWLSALLFAGVHLYIINFIPVFLLGLALAYLYERSGRLAVPIIAHATVNGLVAVIAVSMERAA